MERLVLTILFYLGIGTPQDSGISLQTVLEFGPTIPLFGVCMGLQCMGEAFGGSFESTIFGAFVSISLAYLMNSLLLLYLEKKEEKRTSFLKCFKKLVDFFFYLSKAWWIELPVPMPVGDSWYLVE